MTSHRLRYDMEFHEQTYIKKDKNINSHMQINFGDIKLKLMLKEIYFKRQNHLSCHPYSSACV